MMKNKKANMMKVFIFATVIGVILLVFMFRLILVKETGDQYLVGTLQSSGVAILNQTGSNTDFVATINTVTATYDDIELPYDTIFIVFWLLAITFTLIASYKAQKESNFTFWGMLFFGSFILLIFIGFVEQFTSWFLMNFYNPLFSDVGLDTPIMNWFFNNLPLISFLWAIICLGVNRIDLSETQIKGRTEE